MTYDAGSGNYLSTGSAPALNGTSYSNFSDTDAIFFNGYFFSDIAAQLGYGSADLRIDTNGDGLLDTTIKLLDPVGNSQINIVADAKGTNVFLTPLAPATAADDVITGTNGIDYIAGGDGNDVISSFGGSDVLVGGAADDRLDGGEGLDTAGYSGARSSYERTFSASTGLYTVKDIDHNDGDTGSDVLSGVEYISFSGDTFAITGLVKNAAQPIYRLFDKLTGDHIFTVDPSESALLAAQEGRFSFEGAP